MSPGAFRDVDFSGCGLFFVLFLVFGCFQGCRCFQEFDFLFTIAKDLHDKDSFMMLGGGKGNEPLVMNENGKPYRAFLEGKVKGNSYCLIMHLSNQEYKNV